MGNLGSFSLPGALQLVLVLESCLVLTFGTGAQ